MKLAFHLKGESRSIVPQLNSNVKAECANIKSQLLPGGIAVQRHGISWLVLNSIVYFFRQ